MTTATTPAPATATRPKRHRWPKGRILCTWAHRCLDCAIPLAEQRRDPQPCTPACPRDGEPWAEHANHADGWEQRLPAIADTLRRQAAERTTT